MRDPFPFPAGLAALLLVACSPQAEPEPPDHLIWISIDTLRADHLSSYGYPRETSPNLDQLAESGVRFESCFSPTSWTLPAHLSMLTGLAVSVHGIDEERHWGLTSEPGRPAPVQLRGTFISEHLEQAGFLSGGYYSWKYLEPQYGFGPGFSIWERVGRSLYAKPDLLSRYTELRKEQKVEELRAWIEAEPELFDFHAPGDDLVIDRGLEFLDEALEARDRVFLFLHLFDPHDDYVPRAPFDTRFTDPKYTGPIDGRRIASRDSVVRAKLPQADLAQLIALYDGEIAWSDAQVGRLLEDLDRREIRDRTLIHLTSDHGEEFYEHGRKGHRKQLFAESTHVPWILSGGDLPPGGVVEGAVGLVDQVPTVLALLGLEVPDGLSGANLAPVARGDQENEVREYTQLVFGFSPGAPVTLNRGLRRGDEVLLWKQTGQDRVETAYFANAPGAMEAGMPTSTNEADPALRALRQRLDEVRLRYADEIESQPVRTLSGRIQSRADREQLEALGYLQSHSESPIDATPPTDFPLPIDGGRWLPLDR